MHARARHRSHRASYPTRSRAEKAKTQVEKPEGLRSLPKQNAKGEGMQNLRVSHVFPGFCHVVSAHSLPPVASQ